MERLAFFAKMKRLLRSRKQGGGGFSLEASPSCTVEASHQEHVVDIERARDRGDNGEEDDKDGDAKTSTVSLQRMVKSLHFGDEAGKVSAASEIRKLARVDPKAKRMLGELGVVHALVDMMVNSDDDDEDRRRRRAALGALFELSRGGTHKNKVHMLEAGILLRLPKDILMFDQETRHEMGELLLELSLTKNAHLGPEESLSVIVAMLGALESDSKLETKVCVLGALCHFSNSLENAEKLATDRVVDSLLRSSSSKNFSEKALAILGNLVVTVQGKKALNISPMVPGTLIEILTWEEKPKCQELSAYVLMILAHQSAAQRQKMSKSGIVQVLLELALLGRSTLAQKRALKLLQWFKDERGARMGPHSGPQTGRRGPLGSPAANYMEAREGRMIMQKLVKESLHRNMEVITRRANNDDAGVKTLAASTSSKSLPDWHYVSR